MGAADTAFLITHNAKHFNKSAHSQHFSQRRSKNMALENARADIKLNPAIHELYLFFETLFWFREVDFVVLLHMWVTEKVSFEEQ